MPTSCRSCKVDTEKGEPLLEVVCGAPNARAGLIGVFAPLGSYIPGIEDHAREEARARRRLERHDVLGSASWSFPTKHEGIIELPADMAEHVGERYVDVMGLADPVIEVKLTPNRPDCTGVRGIARDLAAAGLGTLKPERSIAGVEGDFECPARHQARVPEDARDACPVFAGRYRARRQERPVACLAAAAPEGRRPAPDQRAGRRDELHQPGSRPPAARLRRRQAQGRHPRRASARRARSSSGLDGKEHAVDETMCVIADDTGPCSASAASSAARPPARTDETKNVLIECAYFDPLRTAATGPQDRPA